MIQALQDAIYFYIQHAKENDNYSVAIPYKLLNKIAGTKDIPYSVMVELFKELREKKYDVEAKHTGIVIHWMNGHIK